MEKKIKQDRLAPIAWKMTSRLELKKVLTSITQGLVDELDAAFARIWLLGPGDLCDECYKAESCTNRERCLHLKASAGLYTRTNGEYRRVPLGAFKIGRIAEKRTPVISNDAQQDDRLPDKAWLKKNQLNSVAGYPLVFRDELLGVIAMFSRRVMAQEEFDRMAVFANQAAVAIKNAQLFDAIKESEAECRAIIESTPNPLLITRKKDGQILYANAHFGEAFGVSPDELLGRKAPDLYYDPSDRPKVLATVAQAGRVHDHEIRVKKIDGTPFWVNMSVQPLTFKKEEALITILSDITARKQAEAALEQLKQKNELILKSAGEGIYGLDQHGNTTFVNPAAADMLGWQAEELLGRPQHALIHHTRPDGTPYPRKACPIYAAFKDGQVHTVDDEVFWRKDGSSFPVEYTSTPIRDTAGHLVGAVVTFRDITERKKAEKELRESRARFSGILDIAREAIISTDESQRIIIFNKGAETIFQYASEEVIGQPLELLIPEPYHKNHGRLVTEFIASDKTTHLIGERREIFGRRKNGEIFPAEASISKLRLDGELVLTVILRDITRRKQAEQALREALAEVEQLKERLEAENVYLQEEIKLEHNFDEIISQSKSFRKILRKVEQVAATDATVLILGETGTGKELVARALHTTSPRRDRPLVKVNCAALPANLIESELFGHEKGAFTGAMSRKQGRFELADHGTIFLDEIGDLPMALQVKLLRVMQEGEFERVGGTQTIEVDVRIIAATNRNLEQAVRTNEFREDLYYRLNVFPITLPPLRERREDIPLLINHFVKKYGAKLGKQISHVPLKVMKTLQTYHFPGNVRELENIVERALILAQGDTLQVDESLELLKSPAATAASSGTLAEVERQHIISVLRETSWRVEGPKGAALRLGMNPNTLRSRMQKLGIKKPT
ncbi:MAG: sigma 54-interacting transcriptional regulator [bacterium]